MNTYPDEIAITKAYHRIAEYLLNNPSTLSKIWQHFTDIALDTFNYAMLRIIDTIELKDFLVMEVRFYE